MAEEKDLVLTDDLKPILNVLKQEDAQAIIELKEEITDNWRKKQIFRTETEMRISVLNDGKHPTSASKYWQAVREMSGMFDAVMGSSFELRRNEVERLKLERKMQKAIDKGDDLKQKEIQISLDQNLYGRANIEQQTKDRVRELKLWSQIKSELDDGSFNSQDVNSHQAESYRLALTTRAQALSPNASESEKINAIGPLNTIERLRSEDGKLLSFSEARLQLQPKNNQK